MPWWVGPLLLLVGVLAGGALIAIGAGQMSHAMERLLRRLDTYTGMPLGRALEDCEMKLARAEARIAEIPALVERVQTVVVEVGRSRRRAQAAAKTAAFAVDIARSLFASRPRR